MSLRRRTRLRIAIVAILCLLFQQAAMAAHACAMTRMPAVAAAMSDASQAMEHGCDRPEPSRESVVCDAHCSQGGQHSDTGRIAPIPALAPAPAPAMTFASMMILDGERARYGVVPPSTSWHRPTSHPAGILLI